jgi:hypothetical protein
MSEESAEKGPTRTEKTRATLDQAKFVVRMAIERLRRPDLRREEEENRARREILKYVVLDKKEESLALGEIEKSTERSRWALDSMLGEEESIMIGTEANHSLLFHKTGQRYTAAHFHQGKLQTLASIDLAENAQHKTRVLFTNTHEGRIESSQEPGYELTRTTAHTFNFLVERAGLRPGQEKRLPPKEFQDQIEKELAPPEKLLLREDLFHQINEAHNRPLENGGVFLITDTALGSPLGSLETIEGRRRGGFPAKSEIDDFMQILLCRGDKRLAQKVKAIGQTSRGNAFTEATFLAASIGEKEEKPVFPGYNPYLQAYEKGDPIRVSPTALAILELGKAQMAGKEVALVDGAPTTERVYATAIKLAKEKGINISKVPTIFAVGVDIVNNEAGLVEGLLNYNYSLGKDCERGFQLALEHFDDITLFSVEMTKVGTPIAEIEEFANFMAKTGKKEYQRIGEAFLVRAKHFESSRRSFETESMKELGRRLKIPENSFIAQDTLIGAFLAHPEWFVVKEMPLKYRSIENGTEKRKEVKIITRLTPEGEKKFRPWLWSAIKANFS